jgi:transcription antitermination factor NusG
MTQKTWSTDVLDLGSWCILRMASGNTLRLAKSLRTAGIEAWAPIAKRVAKMPRTGAQFDKESALMPSYAFARVEHVDELLHLEHALHRAHPKFVVFRHRGGIPLIADDQLDALRSEEARKHRVFEKWRRRGSKPPKIAAGTEVRLPDGPFAGYSGIVERTQGQFTIVGATIFGKAVEIQVASLLLAENVARDGLPHGIAA